MHQRHGLIDDETGELMEEWEYWLGDAEEDAVRAEWEAEFGDEPMPGDMWDGPDAEFDAGGGFDSWF